jgi:hypothetical protein
VIEQETISSAPAGRSASVWPDLRQPSA